MSTCVICLENTKKTDVTITKCNHTFCTSCLLTNIHESNKCPICRTELTKKIENKIQLIGEVSDEISREVIVEDINPEEISEKILNESNIEKKYEILCYYVDSIVQCALYRAQDYINYIHNEEDIFQEETDETQVTNQHSNEYDICFN